MNRVVWFRHKGKRPRRTAIAVAVCSRYQFYAVLVAYAQHQESFRQAGMAAERWLVHGQRITGNEMLSGTKLSALREDGD